MGKGVLLAGVGIIVIGGAAASPLWMGNQIEGQFKGQLQALKNNEAFPPWMQLRVDQYNSGWLQSTARTTFTLDLSEVAQQDPQANMPEAIDIVVDHVITHGPYTEAGLSMGIIQSNLVVPTEYQPIVSHYFGEQSPFQQTTVVKLNGDSSSHFEVPAYQGPSHDNTATINWQGMNGTVHGEWQKLVGKGNITMPLLEITAPEGSIAIKSVAFDVDSHFSPEGLTLGNGTMTLAELHMDMASPQGERKNVRLTNFRVGVDTDQSGNLVSMSEKISFDALSVENEFKVGPGELVLEANKLDASTLVNIQKRFRELEQTVSSPEQLSEAYGFAMLELLPELLKYSPEVKISKLGLTTEMGDVNGSFLLGFNGEGDWDMSMPMMLIPRLIAEIKLDMPSAMTENIVATQTRNQLMVAMQQQDQAMTAEELEAMVLNATQQQLMQLEQQGILIQNNGRHASHLNFTNGQLTLNGEPADQLLGMLPIPPM